MNIEYVTQKKWIVLEENPRPDDYIAVMVAETERILSMERKPCSLFSNSQEAMDYARDLQKKYSVRNIRLFYLEGHSENI